MRILTLVLLLLTSLLHAEDLGYSDEPAVQENVLYVSYETLPEQVLVGEVFPITFKTLSTIDQFEDIVYDFSNGRGIKLITKLPNRRHTDSYLYDTFYFQALSESVRLPDVTVSILFSQFSKNHPTTLRGEQIHAVSLNPGNDFAQILSEAFSITQVKTTRYDRKNNILVFSATAKRSNLENFTLKGVEKQGFESLQLSHDLSEMTYYVVLPRSVEELQFSYFDLTKSSFQKVLIPVIPESDAVSTQTDIKPIEHTHEIIKVAVAGAVSIIALFMLYIRRKLFYLVIVVLPLIYVAYAAIPIRYVCIKEGSPIYLLPMKNATVFELAEQSYTLEVQGEIESYTKIKLNNNNIGWVKNEDLCTP